MRIVLATPGTPLPAATARRFASLVGPRIADVRVHNDSAAARSAEAVDARAYTVGTHVVFGPGQYDPGSPQGDRLLAHELVHVTQQANALPASPQQVAPAYSAEDVVFGDGRYRPGTVAGQDIAVAPPDDGLEREASAIAAGQLRPTSLRSRPVPTRPLMYRIGLGERIERFFGNGTFSPQELQAYLRLLDENGRIEEAYDSDNKARAIVQHWKRGDSAYLLPVRRKILLIREMLSGFTGDDDERAILDLLVGSTNTTLATILTTVGSATLRDDFHGDELAELDRLLTTRAPATARAGRPEAATADVFSAETVFAVQGRFRANAESVNRLNCILIVRELVPRLFEDDPELAAQVATHLGKLTGSRLTMVEFGRVLSDLGLASNQAKVKFENGNGSREPTAMETSAWDTVLGIVGNVQGWHIFGMAVFDGYHSVTVLVDNRPDGPRVYWADQWRIDPGDDFHQAHGSVSGFRRYEKAGFDAFINEMTRKWWNEVHSPDSKCAERAAARGKKWEDFCRYPATLHIWKFRSGLEQEGGRPEGGR